MSANRHPDITPNGASAQAVPIMPHQRPPLNEVSPDSLALARRLLTFESSGALYHLIAYDFGAPDGGAIGVMLDGDSRCVRVSLDALAEYRQQASEAISPSATGGAADRVPHDDVPR